MIWDRKELQVLWTGRSPDHRESREREKNMYRGMHEKNSSPKPFTGKRRGAEYLRFL